MTELSFFAAMRQLEALQRERQQTPEPPATYSHNARVRPPARHPGSIPFEPFPQEDKS